MSDFREGQRVKVVAEFEGNVTYGSCSGNYVDVQPDAGGMEVENIPVEYVTSLVENWPPQIGDVWAVDGNEWFAREHRVGSPRGDTVLQPASYGSAFYNLDDFKALNPVLVRRR